MDTLNNVLSSIDRYNAAQVISENGEWTPDGNGAIDSKHPWFNTFYKKQYDFFYVKTNDFFLSINPVLNLQGYKEQNVDGVLRTVGRGFEVRGWIAKKIGFYTYYTGNDEMMPTYVNAYSQSRKAVPGADYYIYRSGNYNYLQANGYFDFAIVKNHVNATFGYGKNFIGDGTTSLFLSDFSSPYPFLRLNTHIWKFSYQNLFVQFTDQIKNRNGNVPHKYATIHHLNINVAKWLSMGIFEAIVFAHPDGNYDISYMNPVILYRAMEQANGSPDNGLVGYNVKAIVARRVQLYGQFLIDEFKATHFLSNDNFWANKWGVQLGGKYFNAFSINNLDLQAELNVVRPYTYSHNDTVANYSNYNQPLANPLGAGFKQLIGIARYQSVKNLEVLVKGMYYIKGADTGIANQGNNIFLNYDTRVSDYKVSLINGVQTSCYLVDVGVSYQLRRNLFVDLGAVHRNFTPDYNGKISSSTGVSSGSYARTNFYFGIRLNAARRDYSFF